MNREHPEQDQRAATAESGKPEEADIVPAVDGHARLDDSEEDESRAERATESGGEHVFRHPPTI